MTSQLLDFCARTYSLFLTMTRISLFFTVQARTFHSKIFTVPCQSHFARILPLRSGYFPRFSFTAARHYADGRTLHTVQPPRSLVARPILFFTISSVTFFTLASYAEDSNRARLTAAMTHWQTQPSDRAILRVEKHRIESAIERQAKLVARWGIPSELARFWITLVESYESLTPAEKTVVSLIALNTMVFLAWRIPRLRPLMNRKFLDDPIRGDATTLLTSVFSHRDLLHFGLNMAGLWSIGSFVCTTLGTEQFLAFYLSAGIGANVISRLWRIGAVKVGLAKVESLAMGLGASGALYGCLAFCAHQRPDLGVYIVGMDFMPPIRLGYALPALMGIDLLGVLRGWSHFGHHAHLGGAILGLAYAEYGQRWIWRPLREKVQESRIRGNN